MKFTAVFVAAVVAAAGFASAQPHEPDTHLPRGHERKSTYRESRRSVQKRGGGKLTWYSGGMLSNPACGGSPPNDNDMVVAVAQGKCYGSCNQKVKFHYKGKTAEATIRDYCSGCQFGHFDATKGVFGTLASLDEGVLEGIEYQLS